MASSPDHTAAYFALGGVALTGLLGYLQHLGQRKGERERLGQQLDHERARDDRAYLRRAIEDAADRFDAAFDAVVKYKIDAEAGDEESRSTVVKTHGKAVDAYVALLASERRLQLWLPAGSQVTEGLADSVAGLREAVDALKGAPPLSEDSASASQEAMDRAGRAYRTFTDAVGAEAGVSL